MTFEKEWLATANAFIEDTCVIFTFSYLLSRGQTLDSLIAPGNRRRSLIAGLVLGMIGASEVFFPGMRAPYVSDTLAVSFAALLGGWMVAGYALTVVAISALALAPKTAAGLICAASSAVAISVFAGAILKNPRRPIVAAIVGGLSQFGAHVFTTSIWPRISDLPITVHSWFSVPANAFGMMLVMVVVRDSDRSVQNERHQLDLERFKVLLVSADLAALRARIRPHFLFNTLTAIASVCSTDPGQAEKALLKLGRLLRRTLEVETTSITSLQMELEYVRAYVDIQTLRFGEEIQTQFYLDPEIINIELPAFSLQTLVENAFQHGLQQRSSHSHVRIDVRMSRGFAMISVRDDGIGMNREKTRNALDLGENPRNGMGVIDKQLRLLYGPGSRLRVFSEPGRGTFVAFRIPLHAPLEARASA